MAFEPSPPSPHSRSGEPLLSARGIRKVFPGVVANDGIDLDLHGGEIHALLGENGAGKSTLMNVLMGIYRPDGGEIRVDGRAVEVRSPRDARNLGLGMVHQHFIQSERHTVLENIVLGWPDLPWWPRRGDLSQKVQAAARRYGLELDLEAPVHVLPVGERQKVEIVRALFHGARILAMDEPTAVLSRQETETLFQVLDGFRKQGGAVVYISHKLDEVMALADRVTVLRRGRSEGCWPVSQVDAPGLARRMVGHDLHWKSRVPSTPGPAVVRLTQVTVPGPRGIPALHKVSLDVRAGEILGVAGVSGSGQRELADVLAGLVRPLEGAVEREASPVAYIPEDRLGTGLAGSLDLSENLVLRTYRTRFTRGGLLRWGQVRDWARERITAFQIRCPGPRSRTAGLSGGNLQKVILARELEGEPQLIVASYPCRGLDVGAAEDVRSHLLQARGRGAAVVLVSEDLEELCRLSDRVGVLFRGRLLDVLPVADLTVERLGLLLGGAR